MNPTPAVTPSTSRFSMCGITALPYDRFLQIRAASLHRLLFPLPPGFPTPAPSLLHYLQAALSACAWAGNTPFEFP